MHQLMRFRVPILAVLSVIAATLVLHFGIDVDELVTATGTIVAAVAAIVAMVTRVTPIVDPHGHGGVPLTPVSGDEILAVEDVEDDLS